MELDMKEVCKRGRCSFLLDTNRMQNNLVQGRGNWVLYKMGLVQHRTEPVENRMERYSFRPYKLEQGKRALGRQAPCRMELVLDKQVPYRLEGCNLELHMMELELHNLELYKPAENKIRRSKVLNNC